MPLPLGLILGIETSNPSAWSPGCSWSPGVALLHSEVGSLRVRGTEPVQLERPQDDDLMPAIDRLCHRAGVTPRDLRGIAVSVGPGGFTALRIATATAKMLAEVTGAAAFAVPSARVVARRVSFAGPFAVALASKGDTAWVTRFENSAPTSEALCRAPDLARLDIRKLFADQFLPPDFAASCAALNVTIEPPIFDASAVIEVAAGMNPVDPVSLLPIYPREPEAVTRWRELRKPQQGPR